MNKKIFYAFALCVTATSFYSCKDDNEDDLKVPSGVEGIYVNEVCSSGNDWVEFYNSTDNEVSLGGFHLQDSKGAEEEYTLPSGTKIPAKGFLVLEKGSSFQFGIGSDGDEIKLLDDNYSVVDDVVVPKMADGETYSRKTDGAGDWTVVANGTKGRSNSGTPDTPAGESKIDLLINEVVSSPAEGGFDAIEIYNPGDAEVDMGGFALQDDKGKEEQYVIPAGTKIAPKAVVVFYQADKDNAGGSFTFGISSKGDKITIVDGDAKVIDTVEVPAMEKGTSYARIPDGAATLSVSTTPTPGASNSSAVPSSSLVGKLFVNEVYTFSDQKDINDLDYIELYNASSETVEVGGLKLWEGGGQAEAWTIPAGKSIAPKGFLVIECDKEKLHNDPANYPSWGLSKNEETVVLADDKFSVIDEVKTPSMSTGETYGRKTDGAKEWVIFAELTKGKSNDGAKEKQTVVNTYGIYVNEVFTNNQKGDPSLAWDETKDFIELYNSTDKDFDLGGFSLLDDKLDEGDRFTFKSGTVIKAKSFLTVNVEKKNTDGPSFGLGKGGDKVFLFDKDKKVVDEVVTPKFDDDEIYSYGRKTDGAAELVVFVEVSKNESNNGKKTK